MVALRQTAVKYDQVCAEIGDVLRVLGRGYIESVPYDTGWVARLAPSLPEFENSPDWLRNHQHLDGSWGGDILHYHDRFICTLNAAIALKTRGIHSDDLRIRKAEQFLWREYTRLQLDAHETIGFPVLALSLLEEARLLGLDVPYNPQIDAVIVEKKLAILQYTPELWRHSTMSFSLEAIRASFPNHPDFLEANGSVGTSPAATAALLLRSESHPDGALAYLRSAVHPDGGAPNVSPIDTFEVAWSLNYLRMVGAIYPDDPEVASGLEFLWSVWSPERGIGFSSCYSVYDLDDTAACYAVLKWGGYPVNTDVFAQFEEDDHFRCFPKEIDPSLSAQVRLISALRMALEYPHAEAWMEKVLTMLRHNERNGDFLFDKWHASPFYLTCIAVEALTGLADDLVLPRIKWLLANQRNDGGWGYYGMSTPEESAYALMALLWWDRQSGRVEPMHIEAAWKYLSAHYNTQHLTPMWLGKCLYTPTYVVRAALLAAVYAYLQWRGR